MLHQEASNYLSNKAIEDERDRRYAYTQPVVNGQGAIRPTPAREEALRKQVEDQAIEDNYARYRASLPSYMIKDRPGLGHPPIDLFTILSLKGLERPLLNTGRKLYNSVTRNMGQTSGNLLTTELPRFNYNIVKFYPDERRPPLFLYSDPKNRLRVDSGVFKKIKYDKISGDIKSIDKSTDRKLNKLIAGINKEDKRAIEWNSSPYRIWKNENDRIQYLQNLEYVKNFRPVGIANLDIFGSTALGFMNKSSKNIFIRPQKNKLMLNTYYHEYAGHAGDIYHTADGVENYTKSKLLGSVTDNYVENGKYSIMVDRAEGKIPLLLRGADDKLMKTHYKSYINGTLTKPEIKKDISHLTLYKANPVEIVARVEELRWDLLTNKVKFNGKPFSPSTVIGDKEFAILNRPFSAGFFDERSLLKKYKLDMFTPETLKDLMNKLPFAAGIGTAGLAGYGLSED
jgi:hypothetical protein